MNAFRQIFLYSFTALAAFLCGPVGVNFHKLRPSFFSFVSQPVNELSPCGIKNTFRQASLNHTLDIQFLNSNQIILINNPSANLVSKIRSAIPDPFVNTLKPQYGFASIITPFFLSADASASTLKFAFKRTVEAGIADTGAVRADRKTIQPNVHPNSVLDGTFFWSLLPVINRQLSKPFACTTDDTQDFDLAFNRPQVSAANITDLGNTYFSVIDNLARIRDCKAVVSVRRFETRITSFAFAFFQATKETAESKIHAADCVSGNSYRHRPNPVVICSPFSKHRRLIESSDPFAFFLPRITPNSEAAIEDVSSRIQVSHKMRLLSFVWIKADFHDRDHGRMIADLTDISI